MPLADVDNYEFDGYDDDEGPLRLYHDTEESGIGKALSIILAILLGLLIFCIALVVGATMLIAALHPLASFCHLVGWNLGGWEASMGMEYLVSFFLLVLGLVVVFFVRRSRRARPPSAL